MNKGHIKRLIADLRENEDRYDQGMYFHDCGSPACIAGHAAVLAGFRDLDNSMSDSIDEAAEEFLGITSSQADDMFRGDPMADIADVDDAIDMLERFMETGKVVWRKVSA